MADLLERLKFALAASRRVACEPAEASSVSGSP